MNIQSTKDYDKFKMMAGNRTVNQSHVTRLKNEMLIDASLLEAAPILVNENFFIVDGQHRFAAAKDLGLPIYYIQKDNLSISTARHMNVTQRGWTIKDFAESYAAGGNKNYEQFLHMVKKFPRISPSIIILYMIGGEKHDAGGEFRNGSFVINDIGDALEWLETLDEIRIKAQIVINKPLASSFLRLFKENDESDSAFDTQRFLKKLDNENAAKLLQPRASVKDCLRSIEDTYNFMNNTRVRLY